MNDNDEWTIIYKNKKVKQSERTRNSNSSRANFQINRPINSLINTEEPVEDSGDEHEEINILENPIFWNKFALIGDITQNVHSILIKYQIFPKHDVMELHDCFSIYLGYKVNECENSFEDIVKSLRRKVIFVSIIPRFTPREYGNGQSLYFIHIRFNFYLVADETKNQYDKNLLKKFSKYLGFLGQKHTHVPITEDCKASADNFKNFNKVMKILKDKRKCDKFQPGSKIIEDSLGSKNVAKTENFKNVVYYVSDVDNNSVDKIYKCKLFLKDAHSGYGEILEGSKNGKKINLHNRKNCSRAFNGDIVNIMMFENTNQRNMKKFKELNSAYTGRVISVISSEVQPINKIFLCRLISGTTISMEPICKTIPIIHVDNKIAENLVQKNFSDLRNGLKNVIGIENIIEQSVKLEFAKEFADRSLVTIKQLKENLETTLNKIYYVDCYSCDFLFLVLYREWDDNKRFPSGEVVGLYTPDVTFGKTLNLIKVSCDIPVIGIDDEMPLQKEIRNIKIKKMPNLGLNFDKNEKENKKLFFTLKYPNKPYSEIAYSFEQMDLDNFVIGVHVVNVSDFIKINDYLDICAQDRFFTYLLPNISRNDLYGIEPDYLLSTAITTEFLSINMKKNVEVFSFYFHIDGNNKLDDISSEPLFLKETIILDKEIEVNTTDDIIKKNLPNNNFLIKIFQFCETERHKRVKNAIPSCCFYPDFRYKINQTAFIIEEELKFLTNKKASLYYDCLHSITQQQLNEWCTEVVDNCNIKFSPFLASKAKKLEKNIINKMGLKLRLSQQFIDKTINLREKNFFKCESLFPDIGIYHRKWKLLTGRDIKESFIPDTNVQLSITNPLSCYFDIVMQRILQSNFKDKKLIENYFDQFRKFEVLFEKYWEICKAYEVKHQFKDASFILDCVFDSFTEENIFFHHPFLDEINHVNSIYFQSLRLDKVPIETSSDGIQSVTLVWKTRIFCQEAEPLKDNIITLKDIYSFECNIWRYDVVNSVINDVDIEKINEILNDDKYPYKLTSEIIKTIDPMLTLQYPLKDRQIMRIQFNYDYSSGIMKIIPELLIINPDFRICLCHRNDPFKYFLHPRELSNINYKRFREVEEYKLQFIILNRLEGIHQAIHNDSSFFIHDLNIDWLAMTNKNSIIVDERNEEIFGIVILDECWCKSRFLKLIHDKTNIYDPVHALYLALDKSKMDYILCIQSFIKGKNVYWVGHCLVADICLTKGEGDISYDKESKESLKNLKIHIVIKLVHSNFPMQASEKQKYSIEFMDIPISTRIFERSLRMFHAGTISEEIILEKISENNKLLVHQSVDLDYLKKAMINDIDINEVQLQALEKSVNYKFSLIWGPPGTGKTLVGCIIAFCYVNINKLKRNNSTVLYCGPSNQSVDVVAEKLMKIYHDKCPRLLRIFNSEITNFDFPYTGARFKSVTSGCSETLKNIALHHIVRLPEKKYAPKLKNIDIKLRSGTTRNIMDRGEFALLLKKYEKTLKKAYAAEVSEGNYEIILTTAASSCKKLLAVCTYSQVILDECGMSSEPEALGTFLNRKGLEHVVLIGDHKQLKPIVTCQVAKGKRLNVSLFERLYKPGRDYCTMLDTQYRMHPSICEFPSVQFYKNSLNQKGSVYLKTACCESWTGIPDSKVRNNKEFNGLQYTNLYPQYQKDLIINNIYIADNYLKTERKSDYKCYKKQINFSGPKFQEKILFINVIGNEINQEISCNKGSSQSKGNEEEVNAVGIIYENLIKKIKPSNKASQSILVITQYRLQEYYLKKYLENILIKNKIENSPKVSTVIKSQGSESDYVIFSTVRSLPNIKDIDTIPSPGWINKYLGFITDGNQLNVALTRAKKGLFIIGNSQLLSVNETWNSLITDLKNRKCYLNDVLHIY